MLVTRTYNIYKYISIQYSSVFPCSLCVISVIPSFQLLSLSLVFPVMGYYRTRGDSVQDAFTLSPLPYPVLLVLILVFFLAGISWSSSYEAIVEAAQEQFSLALLALPILLIFLVRWLSSVEHSHQLFLPSYDGRWSHRRPPSEGPPPWGAALMLLLLIVMVSFQSTFHDRWFV